MQTAAFVDMVSVTKSFGPTVALENFSLSVPPHSIVGLIGPNGAGKTTVMKILAGLVRPDAGHLLMGIPPERIGASIDRPGFYPYLNARQNLEALCLTAGMRTSEAKSRALSSLALVGLAEAAERKFAGFSTGMGQRLAMAAALLSDPTLLILDEPASGLDPAGVAQLRDTLENVRQRGCTILVSSHLLGEVEQVCDTVAIIDRGHLVASGSIASLVTGPTVWRLEYPNAEIANRAAAALAGSFAASVKDRIVSAVSREDPAAEPLHVVAALDLLPSEVSREQRRLEDIYLRLTSAAPEPQP